MLSIEVHPGERVQIDNELSVTLRKARGRMWLNFDVARGKLRLVESMPGLTLLEKIDAPAKDM